MAQSRSLAATVHVDGTAYARGTAESDLPDGVADQITNPDAWTTDQGEDDAPEPVAAGEGLTSFGSVGQPITGDGRDPGAPQIPADSPAARNLTAAADGPPAPDADAAALVGQTDQADAARPRARRK
jgi:hypothetical protein